MTSRWLLACGVIAGPLFTLGYVVAGALRVDYDWRRHPISSLALGPGGWIQAANFVLSGVLLLAFALGVRRVKAAGGAAGWGRRLLEAAGILLIVAGLFATEPVSGYPPGTPGRPATYSMHGAIHAACAILGFAVIVATMFVFAAAFARRRERGWTAYSLASGLVAITAFFLMAPGIDQQPGWVELGGLFERVVFVVGLGWLTAVAVKLVRRAV
jgi:hypothetical protein